MDIVSTSAGCLKTVLSCSEVVCYFLTQDRDYGTFGFFHSYFKTVNRVNK